jgi:hypothetical protein
MLIDLSQENPQHAKGICTFTARQNPSLIGGSGLRPGQHELAADEKR